jgi:hypothetical protein
MPSVPLKDGECRWCGEVHPTPFLCPWVKALEFAHGDERVTRVEFLTAADFPKDDQKSAPPEQPDYPRLRPIEGG